eukprot:Lithocolla_globosa_v1_NODE_894_length_3121_cov_10.154925.p3 type:complete len:124 gc:universal NODE_894_length_3121_cov_10.154925:418-47(-)
MVTTQTLTIQAVKTRTAQPAQLKAPGRRKENGIRTQREQPKPRSKTQARRSRKVQPIIRLPKPRHQRPHRRSIECTSRENSKKLTSHLTTLHTFMLLRRTWILLIRKLRERSFRIESFRFSLD